RSAICAQTSPRRPPGGVAGGWSAMPEQPDDEAARIAVHHLPRLTSVEQAIIAARCRNRPADDIGKLVGLSKRQVERIITRLTDLITIPLGYDPTDGSPENGPLSTPAAASPTAGNGYAG